MPAPLQDIIRMKLLREALETPRPRGEENRTKAACLPKLHSEVGSRLHWKHGMTAGPTGASHKRAKFPAQRRIRWMEAAPA